MTVPLNSLSRHFAPHRERLAQVASDTLGAGHFVLGPGVRAFEQQFAEYCGARHCIGLANGTDAIELALRGIGIGRGDKVVAAANAAMYAATAVLACGAEPVFAEIDPETGLLDAASIGDTLGSSGARAVVLTHLYGKLAPAADMLRMCEAHGAALIEDCAQAHGARFPDGRRAGSIGLASAFSFYPTKNLGAAGDGGAVVTSSPDVNQRILQLRQYGWSRKYENALAGGRNSRLDELQARFLSVLLPHLDRWNERRLEVALRYSEGIRHPDITLPSFSGQEYVAHLFVVRSTDRDALAAHLGSHGIGVDVHYPLPDHRQPVFGSRFCDLSLPHTEAWCRSVLTLPCFPEIEDAEVDAVISACNAWRRDAAASERIHDPA